MKLIIKHVLPHSSKHFVSSWEWWHKSLYKIQVLLKKIHLRTISHLWVCSESTNIYFSRWNCAHRINLKASRYYYYFYILNESHEIYIHKKTLISNRLYCTLFFFGQSWNAWCILCWGLSSRTAYGMSSTFSVDIMFFWLPTLLLCLWNIS